VQFEIEVGGRTRRVSVVPAGACFAVTVDGHTTHVDVARVDAHTLSLILDSATSQDTVISPDAATGQLTVSVGGTSVAIVLNGRSRGRRGTADESGAGSRRPQRLTAPMPGKIVHVLVAAGDTVVARQPLVVVEAMKMENELRAARDGTVAEIHARKGQSVDAGALLVVIQ
jgi:biotin carboxyl carrier protein